MPFEGFSEQDFEIFELPGFEARMPAIRAQITPKLRELGAELAPHLREATGFELYPHVAQHLRRTVHAPEETWVAFSRSPRAYKPFVHLRVAINAADIKIVCHLEDFADDKPAFAEALAAKAEEIASHLARHPRILSYDLLDASGCPLPGDRLDAAALARFAGRLRAVKGQHVSFAVPFERTDPVLRDQVAFMRAATTAARELAPLYRLAL